MVSRRAFLRAAGASALVGIGGLTRAAERSDVDPSSLERATAARPLRGGRIPSGIARRLATAHVGGRYHFTREPFLLEGARRVHDFGLGGIKLWFDRMERGYSFNSEWSLAPHLSFIERAQHPYYRAAFALPFNVIALELPAAAGAARKSVAGHSVSPESDFTIDEQQVYELARHLLVTYRERELTFLLQNWEGDWMFRGGTRGEWTRAKHPDLETRVTTFRQWFDARQRGVERARSEIPNTRCRVFHAVEVNRVFDELGGIPTVTTHVLPQVRPDFISWSCYDGLKASQRNGEATARGVWAGLDLIQRRAQTTQRDPEDRPALYIGEIGFPEQVTPPEATLDMMDGAMGTLLARQVPYIFHWQLFCNERKDGKRDLPAASEQASELRGFWLVRPDGGLGVIGRYFQSLLANAGKTLPRRNV